MERGNRPAPRRRDRLAQRPLYVRTWPRYSVERQVVYLSADEQDFVVIYIVLDRDELQVLPEAFLSQEKADDLARRSNAAVAQAGGLRPETP